MNNRENLVKRIAYILIDQIKEYEDPRITYGELSKLLNEDFKTSPRSLDTYLWSLSSACIDADYPPLTALVVRSKTNMPGGGYFEAFHNGINESKWKTVWNKDIQEIKETNWSAFRFL